MLCSCTEDQLTNEPLFDFDPATYTEVAFEDINVVSMEADGILEGQTVYVREGRIEKIGSTAEVEIPETAFRVDGQGRYVMPGLIDMHVHMGGNGTTERRNNHVLYLANGVTTVREMWGHETRLRERAAIEEGLVLGPTIYASSPGMDGPGGPWARFTAPITTTEQARQTVRHYKAEGYDFIKVYNSLSRPVYEAIIEEAAAQGLRVVGHVPAQVGPDRVYASGQYSTEHYIGVGLAASSTRSIFNGVLDLDIVEAMAEKAREAGIWQSPTLYVNTLSVANVAEIRTSIPFRRYLAPGMAEDFIEGFWQGFSAAGAVRADANYRVVTQVMHRVEVPILLGTDAGFGYIIPGFSIHEELRLLVAAGLSPYEAIRAGTADAARFLGAEDLLGRVVEELRADLIVLEGDPLVDVGNINRRVGVMVRGRWLPEEELRSMLEAIAASYGN